MGVYLGYSLAHYADFYDLEHVLILGRCTSGRGGPMLLDGAQAILPGEFSALMEEIRAVAEGFGAFFAKVGEGPGYTVDHTGTIIAIGPDGHVRVLYSHTVDAEALSADLADLLG